MFEVHIVHFNASNSVSVCTEWNVAALLWSEHTLCVCVWTNSRCNNSLKAVVVFLLLTLLSTGITVCKKKKKVNITRQKDLSVTYQNSQCKMLLLQIQTPYTLISAPSGCSYSSLSPGSHSALNPDSSVAGSACDLWPTAVESNYYWSSLALWS